MLGRDVGAEGAAGGREFVIARVAPRQAQTRHGDGLARAHILGIELPAAGQRDDIAAQDGVAQTQAGGGVAVVDLVARAQVAHGDAAPGDAANGPIGTGAGQLVAIHRCRAIAGRVEGQSGGRHGFACAHVLGVVGGTHARQVEPHGVAVNGATEGEVASHEAGGGRGVVGLAGAAGQACGQCGRHAVEHAVPRAQHGAGRGGVVLLEVRHQAAPGVRCRGGGVDAPGSVAALKA